MLLYHEYGIGYKLLVLLLYHSVPLLLYAISPLLCNQGVYILNLLSNSSLVLFNFNMSLVAFVLWSCSTNISFHMKPQYVKHVLTIADFLLRLVLISAIALTISSIIGYRAATAEGQQQSDRGQSVVTMESKKNSWLIRICTYDIDAVAVALTLAIGIFQLVTSYRHISENYPWIIVILLVGLGWGIFWCVISHYRIR